MTEIINKNATGLIGAMDEEIAPLLDVMDVSFTRKIAGIIFYNGTVNGSTVVLARCGVGKVNAAVCAQLMITIFAVDRIIGLGVAGGILPGVKMGDIVVSTELLQHDMDATGAGHPLGMIPRMDEYIFPADPGLLNAARELLNDNVTKPDWMNIYYGRILSGDQFICCNDKSVFLQESFDGYCVEMEGAAIAQVCYMNAIPVIVIRSISDGADANADKAYKLNSKNAFEHAAWAVLELVRICSIGQ